MDELLNRDERSVDGDPWVLCERVFLENNGSTARRVVRVARRLILPVRKQKDRETRLKNRLRKYAAETGW